MQRTIAAISAAGLLALAPYGTWADTPASTTEQLEQLMVESADTPAEHEALARYYRAKAADAKALAQHHRSMGKTYASGKLTQRQAMKKHCERIADLNEELAAQYEELAKGEDAAAKK